MAQPLDLVYDVDSFLASRQRKILSFSDFLSEATNELFLIEYKSDLEQIIVWCRLCTPAVDSEHLFVNDVRACHENQITSAPVKIPLDSILALRLKQCRFNWDKVDRVFIQE